MYGISSRAGVLGVRRAEDAVLIGDPRAARHRPAGRQAVMKALEQHEVVVRRRVWVALIVDAVVVGVDDMLSAIGGHGSHASPNMSPSSLP